MRISPYILIAFFLTGCFSTEPKKTGKEGQKMPDFNILLPNNKIFNSKEIPIGKPTIIFYFSPYCVYCKKLTGDILSEMEQFNDVQFLFMSSYKLNQLEEFKKYYNLSKYPNIKVGEDTARFVHNYFGAEGFPYVAVYSKNKTLNKAYLGTLSTSQLFKSLEE